MLENIGTITIKSMPINIIIIGIISFEDAASPIWRTLLLLSIQIVFDISASIPPRPSLPFSKFCNTVVENFFISKILHLSENAFIASNYEIELLISLRSISISL